MSNQEHGRHIQQKRDETVAEQSRGPPDLDTVKDGRGTIDQHCGEETEYHADWRKVVECGERVHFDSRWTEEEFGEGETDRLAGDSGALDEDSDGVEVDFAVGRDEDTEADDQDGEEDGEVDAVEAEKVADEKHDDGADGLEGGKWG